MTPERSVPAPTAEPASSGGPEMVLSRERLEVGTVRVPSRRVRLEKYVVTETRTITVEVAHERVRLVEIDLPSETMDDGEFLDGRSVDVDDPAGAGRWLTLHEERIEVVTRVVPVERVRLAVRSVPGTRTVTETVRREDVRLETVEPGPDAGSITTRDP